MKPVLTAFLIGSLALNIALLAAFSRGIGREPSDAASRGDSTDRTASTKTAATPPAEAPKNAWDTLDTADPHMLAGQLRSRGFPPHVANGIVKAQIADIFAARRRALDADGGERPYWKTSLPDRQLLAAQRELRQQHRQMVRDVLGEDPDNENPYTLLRLQRDLGHLPPAKAEEVRDLMATFEQRRREVWASGVAGVLSPLERDKMVELEREQREAIRAMLTPAEFLEYELRASRTASVLREELVAFNPTEDEFRQIFELRRSLDEQFNPMSATRMSREEMQRRSEAQRQMREQVKALLGPERGAVYERSMDFEYRRTSQLVARLELPPETTDQLHAVRQEFEQRRNETRRGVADRDELTRQMTALQTEALQKIAPLLRTPEAIEAYKQYGGNWLESLAPPSPRPRPGSPR